MKIFKKRNVLNFLKNYFTADLRSLGLFRIILGFVILFDLLDRSFAFKEHYTDLGPLPKAYVLGNPNFLGKFSIHLLSGDPGFQIILFILAGFFALLLLVGFCTRIAAIFSWVFLISLHWSNTYVLFGADSVLRVILLLSIFLPLGERFSIDSKIKKSKFPDRYFSFAVVSFFLYIASIYLFSALWKFNSGSIWFPDGEGAIRTLNTFFSLPSSEPLLRYPELLKFSSYSVLVFEMLTPLLLFFPIYREKIRFLTIILLSLMHLSFGIFINLGIFAIVCITSFIPLIPSEFWERIVKIKTKKSGFSSKPNFYFKFVLAVVCLIIFIGTFISNVESFGPRIFPSKVRNLVYALGISQTWDVFASGLQKDNIYFMPLWSGILQNRSLVFSPNYNRFTYDEPKLNQMKSSSNRWVEFIRFTNQVDGRKYFAEYLCRKWNSESKLKMQKVRLELIPLTQTGSRKIIFTHSC